VKDYIIANTPPQQKAMEETKAVFEPLRQRIAEAVLKLEENIAVAESESSATDQIEKAKEALAVGKKIAKE
jgi:tubulin-specific chaperone A